MRKVLAIPLDEVREQFAQNVRQDVKVVAPEILATELIARLKSAGRLVKPEQRLEGVDWRHSSNDAHSRFASPTKKVRRTPTTIPTIWKSTFPNIRWKQNTVTT
jgi:hypothetical protein